MLTFALAAVLAAAPTKPNIVVILCDDLGPGDVSCNFPAGKIRTPNFDAVAAAGCRFTDAHSGSGVCTPTRYGLITGRYAWRTKLQSGVLGGLSPRLIEPGRATAAGLLKTAGYSTHCVGKWHLGMDWKLLPGKAVTELGIEPLAQNRNVDYAAPIANGPTAVGFDTFFGISASLDMVPYAFIRNDRLTANPTEDRNFPMNPGEAKAGRTRLGPAAPGFEAENVLGAFTAEAETVIRNGAKAGKPFFLYLPLASPHTPVAVPPAWRGKSGLTPYADFVLATDDAVGRILKALDAAGVAGNTLVIVTSDNGCSPAAGIESLRKLGHDPCAGWRGTKADVYEGGHRVPFLVRWPGAVKPGTTDARTTGLTDVFATVCAAGGAAVPAGAGEDSQSIFAPRTAAVVHHSIKGNFAIRDGDWKLCLCPGSGGWSAPRPGSPAERGLPAEQLFNLKDDPAEKVNLIAKHPAVAAKLLKSLEDIVAAHPNAVPVAIRK